MRILSSEYRMYTARHCRSGLYLDAILLAALTLCGCATYKTPIDAPRPFRERAVTESTEGITVKAVVLSDEEAAQAFAAPLAKHDIQAVWLEVDSDVDQELVLNLLSVDPDYYSPVEAAHVATKFGEKRSDEKARFFLQQQIPMFVGPHSSVSGFMFTNHDPGAKVFNVELLAPGQSYRVTFAMGVPGFASDFSLSKPGDIYTRDELTELSPDALRDYLGSLPCCALGGDQKTDGDPLNIVMIGDGLQVVTALVSRGWDLTETLRTGTAWRTATSSVFRSRYRTSPVSPLYLFGRPQDAAFQKARKTVDERNHLRLWRAPVTFRGQDVWVGQISRDIGVKLSSKTVVTHRIDPVVDEARTYLLLDLVGSGQLSAFGFASGVGISAGKHPRQNFTKDPYYTDGLRAVMLIDEDLHSIDEIRRLDWEKVPREFDAFDFDPVPHR